MRKAVETNDRLRFWDGPFWDILRPYGSVLSSSKFTIAVLRFASNCWDSPWPAYQFNCWECNASPDSYMLHIWRTAYDGFWYISNIQGFRRVSVWNWLSSSFPHLEFLEFFHCFSHLEFLWTFLNPTFLPNITLATRSANPQGMAGCLALWRCQGQPKPWIAPLYGEDLTEAAPGAAQGASGPGSEFSFLLFRELMFHL